MSSDTTEGGTSTALRRAGRLSRLSGDRPAPRAPRLALSTLLGALSTVLLIAAVVRAGLWLGARHDSEERNQVAEAAGRFSDRFLTIDGDRVDQYRRGVEPLLTGAFRRTFAEGLQTGVLQAFLSRGSRTEATVREVFTGDVDDGRAHVLVQAETTSFIQGGDGQPTTPVRNEIYVEIDLVKQGGRWLVDHLSPLEFGRTGRTSQPGTSATTVAPSATGGG